METKQFIQELTQRMEGAIRTLDNELKGLRTGRASTHLLDPVVVEAYGDRMPLAQLSTVATADARTITVQVWDKTMVKPIEKAITEAGLGLNPSSEGQLIRIPVPSLNEERRKELVKLAHKYGENAKISVRNVRRDGIDASKKAEKDGDISEDEQRKLSDETQKLTDNFVSKIDTQVKSKEQEILTV